MKITSAALMAVFVSLVIYRSTVSGQELKPVWGVTGFGGPQREGSNDEAHGIGGIEFTGLAPLGKTLGVQGGVYVAGGRGLRFGLSAGPVLAFPSSKAGLFVDYEHRRFRDGDFASVRGSWASYFESSNLEFGYSQPVSSVQRSDGIKQAGINQLQGLVRVFLNPMTEFNVGMQLNSFAGPLRKENGGIGTGGIVGFSFMPFEPLVINLFQAQFDNRERYKVVSSLQLAFGSTLQEWRKEHISVAPGGGFGGIKSSECVPTSANLFCEHH